MPYRIAVADSSVSVQKALQLVFPEPEDKVAAFDDGLAFLTALPDLRPDAILAALNLPGRDGYEIARFLKGREEYRRVPLILLRGAFEPLDEERLIGLEPRAVVTKPFDSEKLAAAVRDLVDQEVCPPDLPEDPIFEKPSSSGMAGGRGPEDRPSFAPPEAAGPEARGRRAPARARPPGGPRNGARGREARADPGPGGGPGDARRRPGSGPERAGLSGPESAMPAPRSVIRIDRCGSTMDEARALARSGAADGTVVAADAQDRGRGTRGRVWLSRPGLGLYASYVVRFRSGERLRLELLPLAAGLAARDALREAAGVEARLKWPNDLVLGRLKIGGVLCESSSRGAAPRVAIVGVGLNLGHGAEDFPPELRPLATSARLAAGAAPDRDAVLAALVAGLDRWTGALRRGDRDAIIESAAAAMAFAPGDRIVLSDAAGSFAGVWRGLAADGRPVVEREGAAGERGRGDARALDWA